MVHYLKFNERNTMIKPKTDLHALLLNVLETLESCEGYVNCPSRSPSMLTEVVLRQDQIKEYLKKGKE